MLSGLNTRVDGEGYDPFLLILRNPTTNEETVWPFFRATDRRGTWRGGQFGPMLEANEWRALLERL